MIESPILDEVREILKEQYEKKGKQEGTRENIVLILQNRFGVLTPDRIALLNRVTDLDRLRQLLLFAGNTVGLDEFFAEVVTSLHSKDQVP